MRKTAAVVLSLVLSACHGSGDDAADTPGSDTVFRNGRIYTVDGNQPWAEAIAVAGSQIVFVGSNAGVADFVGSDTTVVDLDGRFMMPGINDTHVHPHWAGQINSVTLNLFPYVESSKEEVLEVIRSYADTLGPDEWVFGSGFMDTTFLDATRHELDAVTGGRPAALSGLTQHNSFYNTKAIELLGIADYEIDPQFGTVVRLDDGTPSGILKEGAHFKFISEAHEMGLTDEQQDESIRAAFALANEQGITAVFDTLSNHKEASEDVYRRLHERGELTVRLGVAMYHRFYADDDENFRNLMARRFDGDDMLSIRSVKFMVDGVPGETAAMFDPYLDGTHPGLLYDEERLNEAVDAITEAGLRAYFHAEGDYGIYASIKALEYADETGKPLGPDARPVITHVDHLRVRDIPLMKRLGILGNIQPHWAASNDFNVNYVFPNVKKDVVDAMFPFQVMFDGGLRVSIGSDWPTSPEWTPWELMQISLTRTQIDGRGGRFPGQALKLEDVVRAFTLGGAHLMFRDDITGSLEVGKRADLVVLDRNLFETDTENLHKTRVLLTLLDGRPVWGGLE